MAGVGPAVIREINAPQSKNALILATLHYRLFPTISIPTFDNGKWWVAWVNGNPVGFAHVCPSMWYPNAGYFARVGVMPGHRGNGLQRRFMKKIENHARKQGWEAIYSDTRKVPHSAANMERMGYKRFTPETPWGYKKTTYWVKHLVY